MQRKDQKSLEEALALLQGTVYSFSMKVCGEGEDAEDAMQEVLVESVPNLRKFDSPRALMVWLYKVAKSCCLMSRRKRNSHQKKLSRQPKNGRLLNERRPQARLGEPCLVDVSLDADLNCSRTSRFDRALHPGRFLSLRVSKAMMFRVSG